MSDDTTDIAGTADICDDADGPDSRPTPTPPPCPAAPAVGVPPVCKEEVTAGMEAVLAHRHIDKADWDDLIQETRVRAWMGENHPDTIDGWRALCQKIIGDLIIDHIRKHDRRGCHDAGVTSFADDHPDGRTEGDGERRDPIDERRMLELFEEMVADGEVPSRSRQIVAMVAESVPQDEIAEQLGVSHQTVRNDYTKIKKAYRERLREFLERGKLYKILGGTGTLVVLLAVGWWLLHRQEQPEAKVFPDTPLTDPRPAAHTQWVKTHSADLRAEGLALCKQGKWIDCLVKLDEAKELDPAGDASDEVQTVRAMADDEIRKQYEVDAGHAPTDKKPGGK